MSVSAIGSSVVMYTYHINVLTITLIGANFNKLTNYYNKTSPTHQPQIGKAPIIR